MVGLGGGFIVVPVLLLFFGLSPAVASGTGLALVVANSASGAFAFFLQRRVHVRIGLLFAIGGFPGSIAGAILSARISSPVFDWLFAVLLAAVAADMTFNREKHLARRSEHGSTVLGMPWYHSLLIGVAIGLVSSLFGVGGGVLFLPSLLYLSDLPAHMVSATSQFGIFLTSPIGFAAHALQGDVKWTYALPLALGGLLGGPIGARISRRVNARRLMGFIAAGLLLAAVALVARHFTHA